MNRRQPPFSLIARTDADVDGLDLGKALRQMVCNRARKRRNGTGTADDRKANSRCLAVQAANAGHELAPVGQVDVVRTSRDTGLGDKVLLPLEWAGCVNHNIRCQCGEFTFEAASMHVERCAADFRHRKSTQCLCQRLTLSRRPAGHNNVQAWLARQPLDESSPEEAISANDQYSVGVHDGV